MGPDLGIIELLHWITYIFPSLSQYAKIIVPVAILIISAIGVFSNILPEPGVTYPIPDIADLDAELKDKGIIVYRLTRFSRKLIIFINIVITSGVYRWFYAATTFCSNFVDRLRGRPGKSATLEITPPKPYKIRLLRRKLPKDEEDQ